MQSDYYKRIWNKVLSSGEQIKYEFGISDQYIRMKLIFFGYNQRCDFNILSHCVRTRLF